MLSIPDPRRYSNEIVLHRPADMLRIQVECTVPDPRRYGRIFVKYWGVPFRTITRFESKLEVSELA